MWINLDSGEGVARGQEKAVWSLRSPFVSKALLRHSWPQRGAQEVADPVTTLAHCAEWPTRDSQRTRVSNVAGHTWHILMLHWFEMRFHRRLMPDHMQMPATAKAVKQQSVIVWVQYKKIPMFVYINKHSWRVRNGIGRITINTESPELTGVTFWVALFYQVYFN